MKIAVPVNNEIVNDHFGHSEHFAVYTTSPEQEIIHKEIVTAGEGCGCKSGIAGSLAEMGVTVLLAGNIGGGAINHLNFNGIDVVRGCHGQAEGVIKSYLKGELTDSGETCSHHHGH